MILVDSSVWIDYFRGTITSETNTLDRLLALKTPIIGDLILTEVLQGFRNERDFKSATKLMTSFDLINTVGEAIAVKAAKNYRTLRGLVLRYARR